MDSPVPLEEMDKSRKDVGLGALRGQALTYSLVAVLLLFTCSSMSDSLWSHGLQHAGLPCPSLSPRVCSNSCPLNWWHHPTIWSSVTHFSSCLQSSPASWSFPMSWLFESGSQSIRASASASVLPVTLAIYLISPSLSFFICEKKNPGGFYGICCRTVWGWNEIMHAKHPTQSLALGRWSVHIIDLSSLPPPSFWILASSCVVV